MLLRRHGNEPHLLDCTPGQMYNVMYFHTQCTMSSQITCTHNMCMYMYMYMYLYYNYSDVYIHVHVHVHLYVASLLFYGNAYIQGSLQKKNHRMVLCQTSSIFNFVVYYIPVKGEIHCRIVRVVLCLFRHFRENPGIIDKCVHVHMYVR